MSTGSTREFLKGTKELKCLDLCSSSCLDKEGLSAIHWATLNGDLERVNLLIKNGMNVDLRSGQNKTPLHFACEKGSRQIAKILIKNGSDVNAIDSLGMTPSHYCVEFNKIELFRVLLTCKNINLSLSDKSNRTCQDIAKEKNYTDIINLLQVFKSGKNPRSKESALLFNEPDLTAGLADFYKKKSFARPICLTTKQSISDIYSSEKLNKKSSLTKFTPINDLSSDEEENENKKKRLSMSPINMIDDTLNWMKSQSSSDLSKFELSLTEAGKLALDYINKNDPIVDEKRLLMKLINDVEKEDQNNSISNANDDVSLFDNVSLDNDKNDEELLNDLLLFS